MHEKVGGGGAQEKERNCPGACLHPSALPLGERLSSTDLLSHRLTPRHLGLD